VNQLIFFARHARNVAVTVSLSLSLSLLDSEEEDQATSSSSCFKKSSMNDRVEIWRDDLLLLLERLLY
jgi:hypothetical protein